MRSKVAALLACALCIELAPFFGALFDASRSEQMDQATRGPNLGNPRSQLRPHEADYFCVTSALKCALLCVAGLSLSEVAL